MAEESLPNGRGYPGVEQACHDKEKLRALEQGIVQGDEGYNKLHL